MSPKEWKRVTRKNTHFFQELIEWISLPCSIDDDDDGEMNPKKWNIRDMKIREKNLKNLISFWHLIYKCVWFVESNAKKRVDFIHFKINNNHRILKKKFQKPHHITQENDDWNTVFWLIFPLFFFKKEFF